MFPKTSLSVLLALAFSLAMPALASAPKRSAACPEGQVRAHGSCVAACPAEGGFTAPDACECPVGYGKILLGSGGGECRRLSCRVGAAVDPALCDCPAGTSRKPAGKGQVRCTAGAATARAE